MRRHLWLATLCVAGCFRGFGDVQDDSNEGRSLALAITDPAGGSWPAQAAPRAPVFRVSAARPLPDPAHHLFLLRGAPDDATLLDLGSSSVRAATQQQKLALTYLPTQTASETRAQPDVNLNAGARYTLAWVEGGKVQRFAIQASGSPAAGASLAQTLPAELDARVPPNLARALARFDGYLDAGQGAVVLRDAQGTLAGCDEALVACESLGLPPGDCVELRPRAALAPLTTYTLAVREGLRDTIGATLPAAQRTFRTSAEPDTEAPRWSSMACARDERALAGVCVLAGESQVSVRGRSSESGTALLSCEAERAATFSQGGEYALTLPLTHPQDCALTLRDLADNEHTQLLTLEPARGLPSVSIVEVRADPLGPEPSQEYVELLNFGDQAVSIENFTLTTDPESAGARIVNALVLSPGERILAVAPSFDAHDTADGPLPAGVRLGQLDRALSLRNDGSPLYLRDAEGRRVSAAPALAGESPGQCIVRIDADLRTGRERAFAPDPHAGCTPGYASDDA